MTFPKFSPLIRKSFLTNTLSECGLYPNCSGLWLVFSIDFPVVPLYFKEASSRFYNWCVFIEKLLQLDEEEQSHFTIILKMYQN